MRRGVVVCVLAAVAATAAAAWADEPRRVVVTRDSIDLPAGCSPREVAALLLRFTSAFDEGDSAALERLFAPAGTTRHSFQWFVSGDVRVFRRDELVATLLALRAQGDRLRIRAVDDGSSNVPGSSAIGLALWRVAGGASQAYRGKAEIECARRRFYVWRAVPAPGDICPDPVAAVRADVVVACSRRGRVPRAQEVVDDFAVAATPPALPSRCRPGPVSARILHAVRAFNLGAGAAFARDFTGHALMQPYTGSPTFVQLVGRAPLRRFAGDRYARGDGWTASAVVPPSGRANLPQEGIYRLDLRVTSRGAPFGAGGAKVVVDCRTGLITVWVGPGIAAP